MSLPHTFFAGRAGGVALQPLDVNLVFSPQIYGGSTVTPRTINTGPLNMSSDGAMIFSKSRTTDSGAFYPDGHINDNVRGVDKVLFTNRSDGQLTYPGAITNIYNGSYRLGDNTYNFDANYLSYAFKRNERFFDIVTYTGNGSSQTISHSLNQEVGMMWIKRTDSSDGWAVYHRYLGANAEMFLNTTGAVTTGVPTWNSTEPTTNTFTVGSANHTNQSGAQYVAYLFAHESTPQGAIACGGFSSGTSFVELGFQPQVLMLKSTTDTSSYVGSWRLTDTLRGGLGPGDSPYVRLNTDDPENLGSFGNIAEATPTGFNVGSQADFGDSSIYMAIKA